MSAKTLMITDALFVIVVITMNLGDNSMDKNPLFLNLLVGITFAICVIRHINHYRHTKKIY